MENDELFNDELFNLYLELVNKNLKDEFIECATKGKVPNNIKHYNYFRSLRPKVITLYGEKHNLITLDKLKSKLNKLGYVICGEDKQENGITAIKMFGLNFILIVSEIGFSAQEKDEKPQLLLHLQYTLSSLKNRIGEDLDIELLNKQYKILKRDLKSIEEYCANDLVVWNAHDLIIY